MAITPKDSKSGNLASGTTVTVTLPTYSAEDFILLVVSRNNGEASPFSFNANVSSVTELAGDGARRLTAMRVVPNGAQTSFTLTSVTSSVWTWWIASYTGVDAVAPVNNAANAQGNSTSSTIAMPTVPLGYIATGNELAVAAAGVNSTAIWTTDGTTVFSTTTNNAALMVDAKAPVSGALSVPFGSVDRGNNGSSRNQNAIALVLQTSPRGQVNLLTNGSFEQGATIATGWDDEHTTVGAFTYSLVSSGVVDGAKAQQMTYAGQAGDTSKMSQIYQSPITGVQPGDVLTFSAWLSGSFTNAYAIVGIEGFNSTGTYLSEADANVVDLTGIPTLCSVSYTCPPGTSYVAVYVQCPGIVATSNIAVVMDKATLTVGSQAAALQGYWGVVR